MAAPSPKEKQQKKNGNMVGDLCDSELTYVVNTLGTKPQLLFTVAGMLRNNNLETALNAFLDGKAGKKDVDQLKFLASSTTTVRQLRGLFLREILIGMSPKVEKLVLFVDADESKKKDKDTIFRDMACMGWLKEPKSQFPEHLADWRSVATFTMISKARYDFCGKLLECLSEDDLVQPGFFQQAIGENIPPNTFVCHTDKKQFTVDIPASKFADPSSWALELNWNPRQAQVVVRGGIANLYEAYMEKYPDSDLPEVTDGWEGLDAFKADENYEEPAKKKRRTSGASSSSKAAARPTAVASAARPPPAGTGTAAALAE